MNWPLIRRISLYPLLALLSLAVTVVTCLFVNWWAPLFANERGDLPRWLRWFQTFDASLDAGWQEGYIDRSWGDTPFRRFLGRIYWLYRNLAYGFDYGPLSLPFNPKQWRVIRHVRRLDLILFIAVGSGFNLYYHGRYGLLKLGWKAWNRWDGHGWHAPNWRKYPRIPLCFTVNPFQRRR